MIQPTVGRVVLVHRDNSGEPEAAFIAYVHSDRLINVGGVDRNGCPFAKTSIPLLQDGDETPQPCYAEWMPYQKGQAAKTEALEAKVGGQQSGATERQSDNKDAQAAKSKA